MLLATVVAVDSWIIPLLTAVLDPLRIELADTASVPVIEVLAGTEPNKLCRLILLDAGVPVGSSTT